MAIGDSTQRYPLLWILVCYVVGLVVAHATSSCFHLQLTWAAGACLVPLAVFAFFSVMSRQRGLVFMWVSAIVLFFSLGVVAYTYARTRIHYDWLPNEHIYLARVLESPSERASSWRCAIEVSGVRSAAEWESVRRKVIVYFEPTHDVGTLQPGDLLIFRGEVRPPQLLSSDVTFDYASYLTMQGTSGTLYLPSQQWMRVGCVRLTLPLRMARLRHHLSAHLHDAFTDNALGVLAALTLGEKRWLSAHTRAAYADAGASHALALSGLHVGVIYGILSFVLRWVMRKRSMRWVGQLITMGGLCLFALMVGMSASVVRSVFMYILYTIACWVSGDRSSLHILSLAAITMLLVRPLYLFDVSFQLSFMAMASILCVEPYIDQLFSIRRWPWVIAYPLGIVVMSVAAQLGTFPLSLYYFGTFPLYFLFSNLLVIPTLTLLLPIMFVWIGLSVFHVPLAVPCGEFLQTFTCWLNASLVHIGSWPHAVLHVETYSVWSVLCLYIIMLLMGLSFAKRWSRGIVWTLVVLFVWLVLH